MHNYNFNKHKKEEKHDNDWDLGLHPPGIYSDLM
jgi:hypothetical protein